MKKLLILLLLTTCLWAKTPKWHKLTVTEKGCPVQILDISSNYSTAWGPSRSELMVYMSNPSNKIVWSASVQFRYYDSTFRPVRNLFDTISTPAGWYLKQGKKDHLTWQPTFLMMHYGSPHALRVVIDRILFKDGTTWTADKDRYCTATEFDMPH